MTTTEERLKILQMLSDGLITADQAAQLLAALSTPPVPDPNSSTLPLINSAPLPASELPDSQLPTPESPDSQLPTPESPNTQLPTPESPDPQLPASELPTPESPDSQLPDSEAPKPQLPSFNKFRSWWTYPLAAGTILSVLSGWWLFLGTLRAWHPFWLACLWLPLLLGVFLATLGWISRTARWLHIRVDTGEDEWPRHIAISFPIPVRLTAWALRTFGHHIPANSRVSPQQMEVIFESITSALTPEEPLYIEVDEGRDKEKVQVYIG